MTICSKTLAEVEKRLKDHKSLREIGLELCDAVEDPRGKALRLVKMLKGNDSEEFLRKNADWLGYNLSKVREVSTTIPELIDNNSIAPDAKKNFCIDSNTPWLIQDPKYGNFDTRLEVMEDSIEELKDKITGEKGVALCGWLPEDTAGITIRHLCYIDPDITEGYYHIIMMTIINTNPGDEEDDRDIKMKMNHTILPVKSYMVGFQLDLFFYPDWYYNKIKTYLRGESEELPDYQPKFRKSQHPDWKWKSYLYTRKNLLW